MTVEKGKDEKLVSKKILSIMVVIFLGALGSGLWELFLKDILFYLLNFTLLLIHDIFNSFGNSLYSDVGKNISRLVVLPAHLMLIFMIGFYWFIALRFSRTVAKYDNDEYESEEINYDKSFLIRHIHKIKVINYIFAIFITIFYSYSIIESNNNFRSAIYLDQSIEILRPYISEDEFRLLRSEFRQIDTLNKFKILYMKVNEISYLKKIELPKYSPLLVEKYSK